MKKLGLVMCFVASLWFLASCKQEPDELDSVAIAFHGVVSELDTYFANHTFEINDRLPEAFESSNEVEVVWASLSYIVEVEDGLIIRVDETAGAMLEATFTYQGYQYTKMFTIQVIAKHESNPLDYPRMSLAEAHEHLDLHVANLHYESEDMYSLRGIVVAKYINMYVLFHDNDYLLIENLDTELTINSEISLIVKLRHKEGIRTGVYVDHLNIISTNNDVNERYVSKEIHEVTQNEITIPNSKIIKIEIKAFYYGGFLSDFGQYETISLMGLLSLEEEVAFEGEYVKFLGYMIFDDTNQVWIVITEGSTLEITEPSCPTC